MTENYEPDDDETEKTCSCGGNHTEDEHDSLAALDEDDDRYSGYIND